MPAKPRHALAPLPPRPQRWIRAGAAAVATIALAVSALALGTTAATAATTGIFPDDMKPAIAADTDNNSVNLGVKFSPTQSGRVVGLQYYQGLRDTGVTTATLWSSSGSALATVAFKPSATVGWRTVTLPKSVQLTAGKTYTASYLAPKGGYVVTERNLSKSRVLGGFLLPANAGVYRYSTSNAMPTSSFKGSNYLADIVFAPDSGAVTTPTATPTGDADQLSDAHCDAHADPDADASAGADADAHTHADTVADSACADRWNHGSGPKLPVACHDRRACGNDPDPLHRALHDPDTQCGHRREDHQL